MNKILVLAVSFGILTSCSAPPSLSLDKGWDFSLDGKDSVIKVDLPHDWAFTDGLSIYGAQGEQGGYASGGIGTYSKSFRLKRANVSGKRLFLDFDGVYMNSTVKVNGYEVGFRPYGYISFSYEITDYVRAGRNMVEVKVDNSLEPSARWYHGCGIYGGVHLRSESPLHFVKDGIFVRTQNVGGDVSVSFETSSDFGHVEASVFHGSERILDGVTSDGTSFSFTVPDPKLWSPEHPELYFLKISLFDVKGRLCDEETIRFGLKDIRWDPGTGLYLNGNRYKIKGVCEHLEGGPVGAAWTDDLVRWKLRILKDMGCNSIRTAHNPQLPSFYDICDEMGFLVMDEAFDGWKGKAPLDYGRQAFAQWWERDLTDFVRRDRNHPCVYVYSVGNETGGDVAADLVRVCKENDPTRLVTSGHSGSASMDVFGVNGVSEKQFFVRDYTVGDKAFIGTETPHTWQVRGFYRTQTWYRDGFPNKFQDPYTIPSLCDEEVFDYDWTSPEGRNNPKQVFNSSYDNATVRLTARHNIAIARDKDWYSGNYRWTGFDYPGEAGYVHGGWPFRSSQAGAVDMAGFPKDLYYLYQSQWNDSVDMVHLLPFWTHPDLAPGTLIPVWAYTSGDEVELFFDGESLGRVKKGLSWDEIQCQWMVPWSEGKLVAVAYKEGRAVAKDSLSTAFEPASFEVSCEMIGDRMSAVTFKQVDSYGTPCPYGDSRVFLALPKDATVISFENGSPVDDETTYGALSRRSFFGLSRAFVEAVNFDYNGWPTGLVAGMICCDRSMKTSSKAYISVLGLKKEFTIRYTTDGSDPSESSLVYAGSFDVRPGMVIKAKVFSGRKPVLEMQEEMTGGLYWGK